MKINPGFYQAYANRALVQRRLKQDDLAFADYNQSIQINPSYAVAYVGRGNMYRQRKQLERQGLTAVAGQVGAPCADNIGRSW